MAVPHSEEAVLLSLSGVAAGELHGEDAPHGEEEGCHCESLPLCWGRPVVGGLHCVLLALHGEGLEEEGDFDGAGVPSSPSCALYLGLLVL